MCTKMLKCCGTPNYFLGKRQFGVVYKLMCDARWVSLSIGVVLETQYKAKASSDSIHVLRIGLDTQEGLDSSCRYS